MTQTQQVIHSSNDEPTISISVLATSCDDYTLQKVMAFLWNRPISTTMPNVFGTNDSILEIPEFYIFCTAPRSVAMQLETHKKKHGCYFWMSSARPDRNPGAAAEYSRDQPVKFVMKLTARGLIDISHYRMCQKAEYPTRVFMNRLQEALMETEQPVLVAIARQMMPMCAYRNGLCTELHRCGKPQKYLYGESEK